MGRLFFTNVIASVIGRFVERDVEREFHHDMAGRGIHVERTRPHLRAHLSNELHVSENTPPTFLWHTANDGGVPVERLLALVDRLIDQLQAHGYRCLRLDELVACGAAA